MSSQNRSNKSIPCYFTYINLTISSLGTTYRAYANDDIPMVFFIAFVLLAFLVSELCMKALSQLPPKEDSLKKFLLKFTIWVLVSAILFGFAYQFGTFLSLTASVIIFSAVISGSAFIFYVYFIYDTKKNSGNGPTSDKNDNSGEKTFKSPSSCPEDDVATSLLEKV